MKRFCEANVIVLDTSGSMDLKDTSNNLSRLENAKRAISSFVRLRRELPSVHDSYFKVVPFDTSAKLDMFSVIRGDMPCGVNQLKADKYVFLFLLIFNLFHSLLMPSRLVPLLSIGLLHKRWTRSRHGSRTYHRRTSTSCCSPTGTTTRAAMI